MSDSGWINHPKYGTVYQPDLSTAGANAHAEYRAWHGEAYDTMSELIDDIQHAAMRSVLNDLRSVLVDSSDPGLVSVVDAIDSMQEQIDDHQHGPGKDDD